MPAGRWDESAEPWIHERSRNLWRLGLGVRAFLEDIDASGGGGGSGPALACDCSSRFPASFRASHSGVLLFRDGLPVECIPVCPQNVNPKPFFS